MMRLIWSVVLLLVICVIPAFAQERDLTSDARIVIDWEHHDVHDGDSYYYTVSNGSLADGDTMAVHVVTPNTDKVCHMVWDVTGQLDTDFRIFEDDPHTVGATQTAYNRNRNSSNTNTTLIKAFADSAGAGTVIFSDRFGIDIGGGANRVAGGSEARGQREIMLKKNTVYLFAVISYTNANVVSMILNWYEHTAVNER